MESFEKIWSFKEVVCVKAAKNYQKAKENKKNNNKKQKRVLNYWHQENLWLGFHFEYSILTTITEDFLWRTRMLDELFIKS